MQRILVAVFCSLVVLAAPTTGRAALQSTYCPQVTCSGGAPSFANNGVQAHPEVFPVFWGSYWTGTPSPTRGQVVGELQEMMNGPYFGMLQQYGVGIPRMTAATVTDTTNALPSPLLAPCTTNADCSNQGQAGTNCAGGVCRLTLGQAEVDTCAEVRQLIAGGQVPPPGTGLNMLYVVMIPHDGSTDVGYPLYDANFTCWTVPPSSGTEFRVAWVNGNSSAGLSHEITEAFAHSVTNGNCYWNSNGLCSGGTCADGGPRVGQGCSVDSDCWATCVSGACAGGTLNGNACTSNNGCVMWANQVSDLCQCLSENDQQGFAHEGYWSVADSACVIPEAWNGVWKLAAGTWTGIGGRVRQIYAGTNPAMLVATEGDNNLYQFSGTPNSWNKIGGPGAMFSVGQGWLLGLTPGAGAVYRYTSASGWNLVASPSGGIAGVYSGAFDVMQDLGGYPWQYLSASNGVVQVGTSPLDQVAVGNDWAAGLALDHSNVSLFPGYVSGQQSTWTSTSQSGAELFIGGNQSLAARNVTAAGIVSAMTANGATDPLGWQSMGGTGTTSFALSAEPGYPMCAVGWSASTGGVVNLETAAIDSGSTSWETWTFGAAGRVVGGGAHVFATGPAVALLTAGDACNVDAQCPSPTKCTSHVCQ